MGIVLVKLALMLALFAGNGTPTQNLSLCTAVQVGWTAPIHEVYEDGSDDWIAYPVYQEVCPITHVN